MTCATTLALPMPRLAEGRFDAVKALTDEALFEACGVRVAFLERAGGVSAAPYDALNVGPYVEDDPAAVARNMGIALDALGAHDAALIQPLQVHGDTVVRCDAPDCALAVDEQAKQGADAVVVACERVAAMLCFADCVPLIAVAPGGMFSVIHAGWRGVVNEVWAAAVRELCDAAGVSAADINVYIGPYIHACHFEVGAEVARQFAAQFGEACLEDERHVNMGVALRLGLEKLGVAPSRFADCDVCTVCDGGARFFSYRATEGHCGRHGAFACAGLGRSLI